MIRDLNKVLWEENIRPELSHHSIREAVLAAVSRSWGVAGVMRWAARHRQWGGARTRPAPSWPPCSGPGARRWSEQWPAKWTRQSNLGSDWKTPNTHWQLEDSLKTVWRPLSDCLKPLEERSPWLWSSRLGPKLMTSVISLRRFSKGDKESIVLNRPGTRFGLFLWQYVKS